MERIGADIDKRIAAEIDNRVAAEVDSRILTQLGPVRGVQAPAPPGQTHDPGRTAHDPGRTGRPPGRQSFVLALGSMLVALAVTAIVLRGSPGVAAIMLMALIWVIVGIIRCGLRHAQAPAAVAAAGHPGPGRRVSGRGGRRPGRG